MIILRTKMYSGDLSLGEKAQVFHNKHLKTSSGRDRSRNINSLDEKNKSLRTAGAVAGGLTGFVKARAAGKGIAGTAVRTGIGAFLGKKIAGGVDNVGRSIARKSDSFKEKAQRKLDLLDVSEGKMSKEEYLSRKESRRPYNKK